jgi:hypothetical protein
MLGIASRYASIDEILRAEQNALQDMVIKEDTDIPFKSRFITNDANVTVEIVGSLKVKVEMETILKLQIRR